MCMTVRDSGSASETFVDILRRRAQDEPDYQAYIFLRSDADNDRFSYSELDRRARHIAARLQLLTSAGERALLLYPPGLEYIAAIFGCFYANVIAVPVYPPRLNQNLGRLEAIIVDAQATLALTTPSILSSLQRKFTHHAIFQDLQWMVTDEDSQDMAEQWYDLRRGANSLALLQYTSGSTGNPKGVMISHENLIYNAALIQTAMELTRQSVCGNWLPPYHDMGLMGGILEPLYVGFPAVLMTPSAFLQQPLRWLHMISRYAVTTGGAPNFAFDLCVRSIAKATPEQLENLDLSSWTVAFTGGEPVRQETLNRFTQAFTSVGFRAEAFYPCYGLAETTLFTTGGYASSRPQTLHVEADALERGQVIETSLQTAQGRSLVSSGFARPRQKVVIVHPELQIRSAANEVGEIWVSAPNVALGYWNNASETARTFQAYLSNSNEGPFLRTGDLGFFVRDELFVAGRLKDLLIVRGRNIYPQDIEQVVEQCHPALRAGCCAVFAMQNDHTEHIVVVQEVERHYEKWDIHEIVQAIRSSVSREFDVEVAAVDLIRASTIHKTSSGKIQRRACRQSFQSGELQSVYRWSIFDENRDGAQQLASIQDQRHHSSLTVAQPSLQTITSWLVAHLAELAHIHAHSVDTHAPFVQYGLGSLHAVTLTGELEQWLGRSLSPTLVYDYPSIEALAHYLVNQISPGEKTDQASSPDETSDKMPSQEPIAIVGMACRFPGATSVEEFWHLLCTGGNSITEVPEDRWNKDALYNTLSALPDKTAIRWGGFLSQIDCFDARFFGISQREATRMDPQQRLLLEVTWEAFEDAGIVPRTQAQSEMGVFIGASSNDYYLLNHSDPNYHNAYAGTGNAHSILANRLSYFFDLRGPSMTIDTACSSALVAVHQACQSIRSGECSVAIAGGVNIIMAPELAVTLAQSHIISHTGQCKSFDANADGYVRSEGCGVVLLKTLADARRDNDTVYAVIRGSAVNQDGSSNGITAPNRLAQEAVIQQALARAHVTPNEIAYVETHGSGTQLGDAIEVQALATALMQNRAPEQKCVLGAVKTNVGHLEAAAGIAGLIKAVLVVKHAEIPPNLHFSTPNPHIPFAQTSFVVPTHRQPWPAAYDRRLAGVSSFGFGGTNAHIVLEAAPLSVASHTSQAGRERTHHLLLLSAQTRASLQDLIVRYSSWLQEHPESSLADICFTTTTARQHFSHRFALVADTREQLSACLSAEHETASSDIHRGVYEGRERPKIAFLFAGQETRYVYMAQLLYETEPVFKRELDHCIEIVKPYLEHSLLEVLYPEAADTPLLDNLLYAQPAVFAITYALAVLWRSWHIEPDVVMGYSTGEYVAACVAGMMSLEEGMRLMITQGRLMQTLTEQGAMVDIFAAPEQLIPLLEPFQHRVSIAVFNSPSHTTLSGAADTLYQLVQDVEALGIKTGPFMMSQASHSPLVDPLLDTLEDAARQIRWQPGQVPLVANLSGQLLPAGTQLDALYWRRQIREPVQFARSIQSLKEYGSTIFLEISSHPTLTPLGKQCLEDNYVQWLYSLHRHENNWRTLLQSAATLFTQGVQLNWHAFEQIHQRQRLSLPSYPFERHSCWFTATPASTTQATISVPDTQHRTSLHPLLDFCSVQTASANISVWECILSTQRFPYLNQYRVHDQVIVPFFTYAELVMAAARETFGPAIYILLNTEVKKNLSLPEQQERCLQIVLTAIEHHLFSFQIFCREGLSTKSNKNQSTSWLLHVTGSLQSNASVCEQEETIITINEAINDTRRNS